MIYPNKPLYVISGFSPPSEYQMGAYGFHIGLQASFAKKCIQFETKRENSGRMNERLSETVARVFKAKNVRPPLNFMRNDNGKDTMMLSFVQVEGNACDLGTGGISVKNIMDMKDDSLLAYHPHNVDSMTQAYMLLSLWLKWFDCAFSVVTDK